MKFTQTEFAKQLFYTVLGTLFLVANISFVSLTASIGNTLDGDAAAVAMAPQPGSLNNA
jgi:hypothetical protein